MINDIFSKCDEYDESSKVKAAGLYCFFRAIEETHAGTVVSDGKKRIMIGSNNYLGLTHHPKVIEAASKAIKKFGTGFTGSRFLNGNTTLHEELENMLANFLGKEAALVFSTGFSANQGSLSCLLSKSDVIYSDRENHASIYEGTKSALGETLRFKHNDMSDLERLLHETRSKYEGAIIVADGVFSMSGDIINLPELVKLAKKFQARVYIDDAHALGVLGTHGEGTEAHFKMPGSVDILMGTFSKSLASVGGYLASTHKVIEFVKHKARHFMFTAALPPSAAATALECLKILKTEPEHLQNLRKNTLKMSTALNQMGYTTLGSTTPIIPLIVGDDTLALSFTQKLYDQGVFATPVLRPAVPKGCAIIRTSYMATHTESDLDLVLSALEKLGKEFNILNNPERKKQFEEIAKIHFGKRGLG